MADKQHGVTKQPAEALSISDASDLAGCAVRTMRRLVAERKISHFRIGRRVLITPDALKEFIEKNTVPAVDASLTDAEQRGAQNANA